MSITLTQLRECLKEGKITSSILSEDISEIIPGKIYLGTWQGSLQIPKLLQLGIRAVLCINSERVKSKETLAAYTQANINTKYIEIEDLWTSSIREHLEPAYEFIQTNLSRGGVYVHCTSGINRSPTIVAYYLLRELRKDAASKDICLLREVMAYLSLKREGISPNIPFVEELRVVDLELMEPPASTPQISPAPILHLAYYNPV